MNVGYFCCCLFILGVVGLEPMSFCMLDMIYSPQSFKPHNLSCERTEWLPEGAVVGISLEGCMEEDPSFMIGKMCLPTPHTENGVVPAELLLCLPGQQQCSCSRQ